MMKLNKDQSEHASMNDDVADPFDPADLFDPVTHAELEKMFPAGGNWAKWHAKAKEKGLNVAREGRGKYNPYRAARWWLSKQAPEGWTLGQCCKRLANNLPPRSHGLEWRLTGKIEGEIE